MSTPPRDFYVGYRPQAPSGLARFVRRIAALLVLVGVLTAAAVALFHRPFEPGVFEFGTTRTFEGVVREHPYPVLEVERPGQPAAEAPAASLYPLVAVGKQGGRELAAGADGRRVRVDGTLVYRDDQTMLELSGSPEDAGSASGAAPAERRDLGVHTLVGEIVDSQCFLGIMKPGRGKSHKSCAVRCISGGVPPVFVVTRPDGSLDYLQLTDADGGPVHEQVLGMVAEPLEITGRVTRQSNLYWLAADPASYRRLH